MAAHPTLKRRLLGSLDDSNVAASSDRTDGRNRFGSWRSLRTRTTRALPFVRHAGPGRSSGSVSCSNSGPGSVRAFGAGQARSFVSAPSAFDSRGTHLWCLRLWWGAGLWGRFRPKLLTHAQNIASARAKWSCRRGKENRMVKLPSAGQSREISASYNLDRRRRLA